MPLLTTSSVVWVDVTGQVTSWINRRGYSVGLGPQWVSHGVTHGGSGTPVNVTFGAFMGSGRADYALGSIRNGNVFVDRWENKDHGETTVKADGTRYCDMTGSGSDDLLFIDPSGDIYLYINQHTWGTWKNWGELYATYRPRQEIHLADFDGDGKCDILLVDKSSGATTVILNRYASGAFVWSNIGVVTGSATCTEGYGNDKFDLGVRWSDIDGDSEQFIQIDRQRLTDSTDDTQNEPTFFAYRVMALPQAISMSASTTWSIKA